VITPRLKGLQKCDFEPDALLFRKHNETIKPCDFEPASRLLASLLPAASRPLLQRGAPGAAWEREEKKNPGSFLAISEDSSVNLFPFI
jgi:hypothetical protein